MSSKPHGAAAATADEKPTPQQQIDALRSVLTTEGALFNAVVTNAQMAGFGWVQSELSIIDPTGSRAAFGNCVHTRLQAAWQPPGDPACPFKLKEQDAIGGVPESKPVAWLRQYYAQEREQARALQQKQNQTLF